MTVGRDSSDRDTREGLEAPPDCCLKELNLVFLEKLIFAGRKFRGFNLVDMAATL